MALNHNDKTILFLFSDGENDDENMEKREKKVNSINRPICNFLYVVTF
jgi:hypothetical protein